MSTRRNFPPRIMKDHKRTHLSPNGAPAISSLGTPRVRIEDHRSGVLCCDFHPSGNFLLSANRDGDILIGDIHGLFEKTSVLQGHQGAVMEAHFSNDGFNIFSCSTDGTLGVWDTFRGFRKAKLKGHTSHVNCVQAARIGYNILCSGSDDGAIKIWDAREKQCMLTLYSGADVTATCFDASGGCVISGGLNNLINIWDLRSQKIVCNLRGHNEKITGISLSPCGSYLLSHSIDGILRMWDIRPEVTSKRCITRFRSKQCNGDGLIRCAWSPDGTMISTGTSDDDIYIWDAVTGDRLHILSGHESVVNDITFHPKEPVLLSASDDNFLFLHEINKIE